MKGKKFKIVAIAVSAVILAVVLAVNIAVGVLADLINKFVIGYVESSNPADRAAGAALAEQIQEEGSVLVKNDGLLPMKKSENGKVNVFGWDSVDWVISGSGSGQVKPGAATDFLTALKNNGIEYNEAITGMYKNFQSRREFSKNGAQPNDSMPSNSGSLHSFNYEFSRLYEPNIEDRNYYTSEMLSSAQQYSDTAIVVIGRVSGESNDSPKVQYKRTSKGGQIVQDNSRTYLEISTEEEALLKYVGKTYENVIVLINSTNVMELGFVENIPGIDSCLIVSTTGTSGTNAIPRILYSDITDADGNNISVSPSGKTADTWAYDLSTSSTYAITGSGNDTTNFYTNGSGLYPTTVQHTNGSSNVRYQGVAYTDYRESIYMGYKWYETADAEGFWDSDYAKQKWNITNGYDDVVQYPFGFGLSYTEFEWKIDYLEHQNNATLSKNDIIKVGVTVTNTGDVAGQDVVQLYYTPEYKANGIEKSAVNLGAFGKTTAILQPGEHEYVELEFAVEDMKSYDYDNANNNGVTGYELEKGTYTVTLRSDAHTVANNKMASGNNATLTYKISNDIHYDIDSNSKNPVDNLFTGEDTTDGVAIDGNSDGSATIKYLSRSNFEDTFPAEMAENREMTAKIKSLNLYTADMAEQWASKHPADEVTFGDSSQGGIVGETVTEKDENGKDVKVYRINELGMALGKNYDDPQWTEVLNRITLGEMQNLVLHGYTQTYAVNSIGKPATLDLDGPNQIGSFSGSVPNTKTGFSSIVLAQSWNAQLAYSMGLTIGNECSQASVSGWYGPGINVHRSPFGGRNYEYYSEDAYLSGVMCAKTIEAAKNKGVFSWLKHICLYETESGRDGMYTWLTEQALREIYLKPFEIAVKDGGATAIMTSYGRIGAVWTGGSEALLTELVRNEWGFKGSFLTDYADHHDFMNGDQMVRAGGDVWMDGVNDTGRFTKETSSASFKNALRTAGKNVIYTWLNALATNAEYNQKIANGEISDTISIPSTPVLKFRWYIPVLAVLDVAAVAGCGAWLFIAFRKNKQENAE